MPRPYDTVYNELAWRDPSKAIQKIHEALEAPLSKEVEAGYSFLLHCLKEVSLDRSYSSLLIRRPPTLSFIFSSKT